MKSIKDLITSSITLGIAISIATLGLSYGVASAAPSSTTNKLSTIQTRAANEIAQRLATLGSLSGQVTNSTKLNSADKSSLSAEISSSTAGLTTLKTRIAADTTADQASTDEATIFTDYRVYAVVVPKVELLTITDNQQNNEAKLTPLAQGLQIKITADQTAGKDLTDVATAQTELTSMSAQITDAQQISVTIENDVSPVLPSNWNANHNIFSGNRTQLTAAYHENQVASSDANNIDSILKIIKS
jgi:hypothetical protein